MPETRSTTDAIATLTQNVAELSQRQAQFMEMMEQMRAEMQANADKMRSEFRELKLQRIRAEKQPAQYPPSPSTLSIPPFTPCASLDETHTMSSPPLLLQTSKHHEILTGFGTRVHPTAIVTPMLSNSTQSLRKISASVMEGFNINSTVSSNTSLDHLSFILKMNTSRNDDSQGYMNAEVPFSVFYEPIHSCLLPVCVYDSVKVFCAFVRNLSFVRIQFSTQLHYTSALWVKPPPKPPDGSFEGRRMLNLTKIIKSAIGYHMIRCRGDLCLPIKLPSMEFKVLPMVRVKFKRVYGTFGIWNEVLLFCCSRMGLMCVPYQCVLNHLGKISMMPASSQKDHRRYGVRKNGELDIYYGSSPLGPWRQPEFEVVVLRPLSALVDLNDIKKKPNSINFVIWQQNMLLKDIEKYLAKKNGYGILNMVDEYVVGLLRELFVVSPRDSVWKHLIGGKADHSSVVDSTYYLVISVYGCIADIDNIIKAQPLRDSNMDGYMPNKKTMKINPTVLALEELRKRGGAYINDKSVKNLVMLLFEKDLVTWLFKTILLILDTLVDLAFLGCCITKYLMFSSPRPPEIANLEDKVLSEGGSIVTNQGAHDSYGRGARHKIKSRKDPEEERQLA